MFHVLAPLTIGPVQVGTVVTFAEIQAFALVSILVLTVAGLLVWGSK